jgi:hypothetical protein
MPEFQLDEIGRWSEIKLEIIREYAKAYSQILAKQPRLYHVYIDGFAGAGMHISKTTGMPIAGSPINVTSVKPPFREYHLVELHSTKASHLRKLFKENPAVRVHHGNCNSVLPTKIFPNIRYDDESWRDAAYRTEATLFGNADVKAGNEVVASAFAQRLKKVAGFQFVVEPLPMRNSTNAIVYYLIFASQNSTAHKIVTQIFRKRRKQF